MTPIIVFWSQIGMRVILDFIPNHTSDQHTWFQRSRHQTNKTNEDYKDFFIWSNGRQRASDDSRLNNTSTVPPNNWVYTIHRPLHLNSSLPAYLQFNGWCRIK